MSAKRTLLLTTAALALPLLIGCQSSKAPPLETMGVPGRALVVSGGNSNSGMTVFVPSADGRDPVVYCSNGADVCPECRAAAVKYFQTGVLDAKCSRSGATRTAVPLATPNVGHN